MNVEAETAAPEFAAANDTPVPRYSYYALAILTLVNFLNYIDRQVLPSVAPFMLEDPHLRLSHTELGIIEGGLLFTYTILAPVFGRLGDRYNRTRLMAIAAALWSVATMLTGFADHFPLLPDQLNFRLPILNFAILLSGGALGIAIARVMVGVGESSYSTITPSLIADYFPRHKRGTALGVFQAAIPMGFALGYVIGGLLAGYFGWRRAFMIVGVPGLITSVLLWRLREPLRGTFEQTTENAAAQTDEHATPSDKKREGFWLTAGRILTNREWLISTLGYAALTSVLGAFATWATVMLVDDKGMSKTAAAVTLGIVTLAGGAAGTFGGGWLADKIAAKKSNGYWLVCAFSSLLGIVPAFIALVATQKYVYLPAVFFAVMLLFTNNAPFHAILVNSVSASIRATAIALNIVIIHLFGDLLSRSGVGFLSDLLKAGRLSGIGALAQTFGLDPQLKSVSAALLIAPAALFIATFFFMLGAKLHRD